MNRRNFIQLAALGGVQALTATAATVESSGPPPADAEPARVRPFEFEEAAITDLQQAMKSGKETAVSITKKYLQRIEETNQQGPTLRAVLEVNPDALAIARELDRERKAKGPRGPLHGIPI